MKICGPTRLAATLSAFRQQFAYKIFGAGNVLHGCLTPRVAKRRERCSPRCPNNLPAIPPFLHLETRISQDPEIHRFSCGDTKIRMPMSSIFCKEEKP